MSQFNPAQAAIPEGTNALCPIGFLNLPGGSLKMCYDAIKAAPEEFYSLPDGEFFKTFVSMLEEIRDKYSLALIQFDQSTAVKISEMLERVIAGFMELGLHEQVSFIRALDKDLRKRVENTRIKINNLEVYPDPLADLLNYVGNILKLFNSCEYVFEKFLGALDECGKEVHKLARESGSRPLMPCGMSARGSSMRDYELATRRDALIETVRLMIQKFKTDLDPSDSIKLFGLEVE